MSIDFLCMPMSELPIPKKLRHWRKEPAKYSTGNKQTNKNRNMRRQGSKIPSKTPNSPKVDPGVTRGRKT